MREKQRWTKRIVGSDTPPGVNRKPGKLSGPNLLTAYKRDQSLDLGQNKHEREREKTRLNFVVAGADQSGEMTIAPTLWASWNALMKTQLLAVGFVTLNDAIHEFARRLKAQWGYGSSVTTRRYLKEAIGDGKNGDYRKEWNKNFGWIIRFTEKAEQRLAAGIEE